VKIQQNLKRTRQQWLKKPILAKGLNRWLIDNGSLTARLQARFPQFSVQPTAVQFAKPALGEADLMHIARRQTALIREVLLIGNQQPVVFAHSVLPRASLRGAWHGLGKLGNKPLGATLFANPKVKRTALQYKKLSACSPISMRVAEHLQTSQQALWARRSIFSLCSRNKLNTANSNCAKILVTEVFLPALLTT
jgi:chorismate--pyruvate lyase